MATSDPPPVAIGSSPVQFVFDRSGGAVIHARLSIWSGVDTPDEKRVLVLFFEDALDDHETFTRALPAGNYSCVMHVFIREDLRGDYVYEHRAGGKLMGADKGDVNVSAAPAEGQVTRHDYVLAVS
jgi:hypothetical protein